MEISRKIVNVKIINNSTFDVEYEVIEKHLMIQQYRVIKDVGLLKVGGSDNIESLTPTELLIAPYLTEGYTSKEIAQQLGKSVRTIETHRDNIKRKLHVNKYFELVAKLKEILNRMKESEEDEKVME